MDIDLVDEALKVEMPREAWRIGCIGSGWIMRDVQLAAYDEAGFPVVAIASRTEENAWLAAKQWDIPVVHPTWHELLDDVNVQVVDIAYPPDQQLGVIREAVKRPHIRGILAQKPLAVNLAEAREIVQLCEDAGVALGVNQNMRYDQSIRALKALLDRGALGDRVVGQIILNSRPGWQPFVADLGRTALLNLSIHHIDAFRFLFGDPTRVTATVRTDVNQPFEHVDGSAFYVLEYADGFRAIGLDNCNTWTGDRIDWRVEGNRGIATGTIGWPDYPDGSPSTIDYVLRNEPKTWHRPRWDERWFPQAFVGTMAQLMVAIERGEEPVVSGADNLKTMAVLEAAYLSAETNRTVDLSEVTG